VGPKDLNASFRWSWHHPDGKYADLPYGTAIDSEKNIYLATDTSAWKLSPTGKVFWSFYPNATIFSAGSLLDGRMHFTTLDGRVWAISMKTGKEIWQTKVCHAINQDNGFVSAHEGVVLAATDKDKINPAEASGYVRALNATTGEIMWSYHPAAPVWNFLASFPDDGTVLYQDVQGKAYRHELKTGKLLWRNGGERVYGCFSDGSPILGNNGIFYTVGAYAERMPLPPPFPHTGFIEAHNVSDGTLIWKADTPMPPNNVAAFGVLPGHSKPSLVQPGGYQGLKGGPTGVWAYDAATGERQWSWTGPSRCCDHQAGEAEGKKDRLAHGASEGYITNPFSAAIMDADGTVYLGHEDGKFFALRDVNGDGVVSGEGEVSSFDTGAAFAGSSSPAIAPGMLAVATCDSLYVFRTK
jgi:outer membrane protein assembly factor BamB